MPDIRFDELPPAGPLTGGEIVPIMQNGITSKVYTSVFGAGTVTTVEGVDANGFVWSIANPSTLPAMTLSISVSGLLKGSGGALVAATNTDLPVMSATEGGAVPTPPDNTTTFLRGDGSWAAVPETPGAVTGVLKGVAGAFVTATNTDLPAMSATEGGAVPTPPNNTTTFLRGDGVWSDLAGAVRSVVLTGISFVSSADVAATDTILEALGKVQAKFTAIASSAGASLVGFIQSGVGAVARTLEEKARESVTVNDYMTVLDRVANYLAPGSVDVTYAVQAALDSGAGLVQVTRGNYRITKITIPAQVQLQGISITQSGAFYNFSIGSWFFCTSTADEAVLVNSGASIKGICFYYPNQNTNVAPVVYPPCVLVNDYAESVLIEYCYFMNPYIAIQAMTAIGMHSSITVNNVLGYPLYRGIVIDNGIDVNRLNHITFSRKYYPQSGTVLQQWVQDNAIAFYINRSDTGKANGCFVYGYKYGVRHIGTNVFTWANSSFDEVIYPAVIEGNSHGISFIGCGFVAKSGFTPASTSMAIYIDTTAGDISIIGCRFWGVSGTAITLVSGKSVLISGNSFYEYGVNSSVGNIYYGILVQGSGTLNVLITGNAFDGLSKTYVGGIHIYESTGAVQVSNNTFYNMGGPWGLTSSGVTKNFSFVGNTINTCGVLVNGTGAVTKLVTNNMTAT